MFFTYISETRGIIKEPYLATAMRLSMPNVAEESNREELLKEIEKLESDIAAGLSDDFSKEAPVTPPLIEKRYLEWPGKRSGNPSNNEFGVDYRPIKIWNRYSDKTMAHRSHRQRDPKKKWAEFVGKRFMSENRPLVDRKRWYEFVGKRYDPILYMGFPKRYMELIKKK